MMDRETVRHVVNAALLKTPIAPALSLDARLAAADAVHVAINEAGGIPFDRLIAICAFRYALGRMTYMVEHVASWLIANRARLSEHDRALIVREIDEAVERVGLGMECDVAQWMRVRAVMVEKNDATHG